MAEHDVAQWHNAIDQSDLSLMMNPLSYFSFQPVLHDWCNKGSGMWYLDCGMVHINVLAAAVFLSDYMSDAT